MTCPLCGDRGAECIVHPNYWTCPNRRCDNNDETTEPGVGYIATSDPLARYKCDACGCYGTYAVEAVAQGLTCPYMLSLPFFGSSNCGGTLRRAT